MKSLQRRKNLSSALQQHFLFLPVTTLVMVQQLAYRPCFALIIATMVKVQVIILLLVFIMFVITVVATVNVMVKVEVLPVSFDCSQ